VLRGKPDGGLEGVAAGFAFPQMAHPARIDVFRPFGGKQLLATLGAFDDAARAWDFCEGAVKFHGASSICCA
jgi:hypothetical protein